MLLDSSAIIEVFRSSSDSRRFRAIVRRIGDEEVYVSVIQLAEVADWAVRNRLPPRDRIESVKDFVRIVQLNEEICVEAAAIKRRRREEGHADFSLLDAIILATARSIGQKVLTFDGTRTLLKDVSFSPRACVSNLAPVLASYPAYALI